MRASLLLGHIKNNLSKRKTSREWFNTEDLNTTIDSIFKRADELEGRRTKVEVHINSFELVSDVASKMVKFSSQFKSEYKPGQTIEGINENQRKMLANFVKELVKFEGHLVAIAPYDSVMHEKAERFAKDKRAFWDSLREQS